MSLLVKMGTLDTERFDTATSWYVTDDGGLVLWPADRAEAVPVAQFASGAWLAVFGVPLRNQPSAVEAPGIHIGARRASTDKAVRRTA
jgi:hypothetical protein